MPDLSALLKQIRPEPGNPTKELDISGTIRVTLYPNSLQFEDDGVYFIAKQREDKYLWIVLFGEQLRHSFAGEVIEADSCENAMLCPLNQHNAGLIRSLFDFTRPTLMGLQDSFGFGDRLGIANPAHLRALQKSHMRPVLAQQSIRELKRTQRQPEEVMDAATWAVFEEGYRAGFGADADHLKTTDDIDLMAKSGFTMFTFDPGEYVINEADTLPTAELQDRIKSLQWDVLQDDPADFLDRYCGRSFVVSEDLHLKPTEENVLRGLLKYGGVITHTVKMDRYFKDTYPDYPAEFELSVDETESVTSPFEHYLVANELKRLKVSLISLAPRFVGEFEKGINYKGDLEEFRREYLKHVKIAEALGPYKISIHSGSDKFNVYEVIGSLKQGHVHVKTAGTSYLEALRTVASKEPALFREILDFSRDHFEKEKATYHISARLDRVPQANLIEDEALPQLLDLDDPRQVLHVTFGKVLTSKDGQGRYLFRKRLMDCLRENEETHYGYLIRHFRRHLDPFGKKSSF